MTAVGQSEYNGDAGIRSITSRVRAPDAAAVTAVAHESDVAEMAVVLEELERTRIARDVAGAEASANAEAARAVAEACNRHVDDLRRELETSRDELAAVRSELAREVIARGEAGADAERAADWRLRAEAAESRLAEIEQSRAWRALSAYRTVRHTLARRR